MAVLHKVKPGNDTVAEPLALAEDIAVLQEAFSRLLGHVKDGTVESATAHARRLGEQANATGKQISRKIEERPFTAMLIAFGIGLLGGKLLSR